MASRTTRFVISLGLLAGSLAIAPSARAQLQVTGGNTTGQAAFFVPTLTPQGNVRLFDVGINTLRVETPNGVTTTSIFTPTAANFSDADSSGTPNTGDTGTLQGNLSGIAFTSSGAPVAFSNRPTLLNFTLNSFANNIGTIEGTLLRPEVPGTASLVFLPGVDSDTLTLDSSGFVGDGGQLQLGTFSAALDDGVIALPSDYGFRDSGPATLLPFTSFVRRVRYEFQGEDVLPGIGSDFDISDGSVRFVGTVNEKFEIRSEGSEDFEFKIQGEIGAVDVTINGPFEEVDQENVIDSLAPLEDYKVEGEGVGLFSFYNLGTYGFSSLFGSDTKFEFRQDDARLDGQTIGNTSFYATIGLGDDVVFDDFDGFNFSSSQFTVINTTTNAVNFSCTLCGSTLVIGRPIIIGDVSVTVGRPVIVDIDDDDNDFDDDGGFDDDDDDDDDFDGDDRDGDDDDDDDDGDDRDDDDRDGGRGRGRSRSRVFNAVSLFSFNSFNSTNTDLFTLVGSSNTALFQYGYLVGYRYVVLREDFYRGQIFVNVLDDDGDRYYIVSRGQRHGRGHRRDQEVVVAYSQIGPACRIFPGLVGLREISADELDDLDLGDDISLDDDATTDDSMVDDDTTTDDTMTDDGSMVDDGTTDDDTTTDDDSMVDDGTTDDSMTDDDGMVDDGTTDDSMTDDGSMVDDGTTDDSMTDDSSTGSDDGGTAIEGLQEL